MLRLVVLILLLPLTFGVQTPKQSIPWQETLKYRQNELFPITIGKYGFPLISVSVNGEKVNLVWDTGNMTNLLITPRLLKRIGLPVVGESKRFDTSGVVVGTFKRYGVSQLDVFGKTWTNEQAYDFWQNDLDGTIGPRFVLGKRFTLDYRNKVMAVSNSPLPNQNSAGDFLRMILSPRYQGMILVEAKVNGRKVLIQVDTGKSRTCVDPDLVASLGLPKAANGYQIKDLRIGRHSFSVPSAKEVSFKGISGGLPEPILLGVGSDILSQIVMSVDYSQQVVMISK